VRTAAAIARQRLVDTAAEQWGVPADQVGTSAGTVTGPGGRSASYGSLAAAAASDTTIAVSAALKPSSRFGVLGTPQRRIDARDIVTGRKQFAMDMRVPGALPTMVA